MAAAGELAQLEWSLGFRNHASGKYLTQETFGNALNVNGTSLKKKQTFYLETTAAGVNIRTHLGRYLRGTKDGGFLGDAAAPGPDTVFTIEPQADGTWALKTAFGFYAHGTAEKLTAFVKELPADGKWVVHLAMHPQVNVKNVMRKQYIHLEDDELHCNESIPWGADALLTFTFFDSHPDGRYGFIASNGRYLNANGRLDAVAGPDNMFLLGFSEDQISLKAADGSYLSCVGAKGVVKTNKKVIGKDELFVIADSEPQFTLVSSAGKYVSCRTGTEIKADQASLEDTERFQLELDAEGKASFQTSKSNYFSVGADGTVATNKTKASAAEKFTIVWQNEKARFQASNGKFVNVKSNGGMVANGDGSEDTSSFTLTLINRPQIVLRGQFGFVALKGASGRLTCSNASQEVFDLESKGGQYFFKSSSTGKYWDVDGDGAHSNAGSPAPFFLEFVARSQFLIKTKDGKYLEGEQNGGFKATGSAAGINTLWEY